MALDVACGAGADIYHLGKPFPNLAWTGVDIADALFPMGLRLMQEQGGAALPCLNQGDAYQLNRVLPEGSFGVVFSV
jgi:ubiquinone/menaquinone biosynthesis C-methylase UbiE